MLYSKYNSIFIGLFLVGVLFFPSLSIAAISLSVNPADGSSSLRLEQAYLGLDNKKDVRLRITSTDSKRYQVFARVLEPIVNEKGQALDLRAVSLATIAGSNTSGTLYSQNENYLTMGEQLLYSSAQNGESDSFNISYALNPDAVTKSGHYTGRIVYTVRSSGGGDAQETLIMHIQAESTWDVSVSGSRAKDRITVNDKDVTEKTADFVKIEFSGNVGQDVRVYQEAVVLPQSAEGRDLGVNGLIYYVVSDGSGKTQDVSTLNHNRSLIYETQEHSSKILVYFQLNPQTLQMQAPGTYIGRMKFTIESDRGFQDYFIDVQCHIQPIFTIDVVVPSGGISFNRVVANSPAQEQEVVIKVQSNLKKPYQVSQNLQALMTNEKGDQIAQDYFTQKVEMPLGSKGKTRFNSFMPVDVGEQSLFISDSQGSPVEIKITYKLQGYQGMRAGNFNAPLQYSLNQN